jgi:hypothetical protein
MVGWIANVTGSSGIGAETRDMGVQILDTFLAELPVAVLSAPLKDNGVVTVIGLAAAAAIILASKVDCTNLSSFRAVCR